MICLEFGQKKLRCVQCRKKDKGLAIVRAETLDLGAEVFSAPDISRNAKAITAFLKEKRFNLQDAHVIISHPDIIFKELNLPLMQRKEIETVITNDIERSPRFASGKYLYTYQGHYELSARKIRVIYFVFLKSVLEIALRLFDAIGLPMKSLSIFPLPLLSLPLEEATGKEVALVFPQEKITHVVVFDGKDCKGIYSADVGLEDIQSQAGAIVDEARFRIWADEIKRIIKSYETDRHTVIVQTILFSDTAQTGDLTQHFSFLYNRPVIASKLPKKVSVESKVISLPLSGSYFGCVGKLLETLSPSPYFNLTKIWDPRKTLAYRKNILVTMMVYLIAAGFLLAKPLFDVVQGVRGAKTENAQLAAQAQDLEARTALLREDRKKYLDLTDNLLEQASVVQRLKKISWTDTFFEAASVLPDDVWLTSFHLRTDGKFHLRGNGMTLDSVAAFIRALEKVELFGAVDLKSTRESEIDETLIREFQIDSSVIVRKEKAKGEETREKKAGRKP